MTIAYLVFGAEPANHQQAVFSVLSLLPQLRVHDEVIVLTDCPERYRILGQRVQVRRLTEAQLMDWTGPHGFFWRIKIKALEDFAQDNPGPLLYLDADTFLYGELDGTRAALAAGNNLMHTVEGNLSGIRASTERRMYNQVKGNTYAGIAIDADSAMWNAGLVGLAGPTSAATVTLALAVCDAMCERRVEPKLIEQFALSLALGKTAPLLPAEDTFGHYWGNKQAWTEKIGTFLVESYLAGATLETLIQQVAAMDLTQTPVRIRPSHTGRRVKALVDRFFPVKELMYLR